MDIGVPTQLRIPVIGGTLACIINPLLLQYSHKIQRLEKYLGLHYLVKVFHTWRLVIPTCEGGGLQKSLILLYAFENY